MVSSQIEESLRHEIESFIEGRLSSIKQEITSLQSQLNQSLTSLLDRQKDAQIEGSLTSSISEHLRAAHDSGVELAAAESAKAKASSDLAIIKAAISEINEQRSQADILKTLVNRASSFAPRVAFFVIKGDQVSGWRARGFEGTIGDEAIQDISLSVSADTVVGDAAKSLATWSGGPGTHSEDHSLLNRLGEEQAQRIVAIPLVVRNKAVAVLYADSAGLADESVRLEALETLVQVAGMAVELLSVSRAVPKQRPREESAAPVESAPPTYTPSSEYAATPVEPPAAAPVESKEPLTDTLKPFSAEPQQTPIVEESPAADLPPVTEHWIPEPPSTLPASLSTAAPAGRRRYGQDADLPIDVASDEERRLHNDARRFARLLISEIKLYNEQKVAEGRQQGDLYDRLREYIDRSREMYDKRVKAEVAARYDYFHGELVNTLAEGDVSKLGSNYPGATVTA